MSEDAEETIGTLEGTPMVERVLTEEDGKLYRTRVCLAYLGDAAFDFSDAKFEFPSDPVQVLNEDGVLIGFAKVQLQGQSLLADIAIDYSTPERLSAETKDGVKYYAKMVGMYAMFDDGKPPFEIDISPVRPRVESVLVGSIVLSTVRPDDRRLEALGYAVL